MNEYNIRLDQTKKVFDAIAELISKNETCTYRYLIYDLLGFRHSDYETLMSGLTITNSLVEREEFIDKIKHLEEYNDRLLKELLHKEKVIINLRKLKDKD